MVSKPSAAPAPTDPGATEGEAPRAVAAADWASPRTAPARTMPAGAMGARNPAAAESPSAAPAMAERKAVAAGEGAVFRSAVGATRTVVMGSMGVTSGPAGEHAACRPNSAKRIGRRPPDGPPRERGSAARASLPA